MRSALLLARPTLLLAPLLLPFVVPLALLPPAVAYVVSEARWLVVLGAVCAETSLLLASAGWNCFRGDSFGGDEPKYLRLTESLYGDLDVDVASNREAPLTPSRLAARAEIEPRHGANGGHHDLRCERKRSDHHPRRERYVVRTAGCAVGLIVEELPFDAGNPPHLRARPIGGREAPTVFAVSGELERVAPTADDSSIGCQATSRSRIS
jgi:hypothetical protein